MLLSVVIMCICFPQSGYAVASVDLVKKNVFCFVSADIVSAEGKLYFLIEPPGLKAHFSNPSSRLLFSVYNKESNYKLIWKQ